MTEWTDPETFGRLVDATTTLETGHYADFFEEGDVIEHDPGLTLSRWGAEQWTGQTLNHDPTYWRSDRASENGYDEPPIHPDYVLAATLGVTVCDLSEKGGYFLGRTDVRFHRDVYPGTELRVESRVLSVDESRSRPSYSIVTWRTTGTDAVTGDALCSYERTNMIPRREPVRTDDPTDSGADTDESTVDRNGSTDESMDESTDDPTGSSDDSADESTVDDGPTGPFVAPDGPYFEDLVEALETASDRGGHVAYTHERGRTIDDVTVAALPLSTLNTAKQHHNADAMADAPSGDVVAYGDVTRSIALGHARSDEATYRELGFDDERFHAFVTPGDTIYGFTRVLEAVDDTASDRPATEPAAEFAGAVPDDRAGIVRFEHVAFNQAEEPVYSGFRTAAIRKRATHHSQTI
ncbi:acyl dehydratase [Halovivax cerinus]|uniref:Acyl dehydratase n=1 Tax=Halovivax cerinus TaxID=1487865 RepID=A0ABD5NN13_9EURY|nr:acyl dehydratase [Halovivax cerinus]